MRGCKAVWRPVERVRRHPADPGAIARLAAVAAASAAHVACAARCTALSIACRASEAAQVVLVVWRTAIAVASERVSFERTAVLSFDHALQLTNVLERSLEDGRFAVLPIAAHRDRLTKILKARVDRLSALLLGQQMRHPSVRIDRAGSRRSRCSHRRCGHRHVSRHAASVHDAERRRGSRWLHAVHHGRPHGAWTGRYTLASRIGRTVGTWAVRSCMRGWISLSIVVGVDQARWAGRAASADTAVVERLNVQRAGAARVRGEGGRMRRLPIVLVRMQRSTASFAAPSFVLAHTCMG